MTRIDFHTGVVDKIHYACRLVRKLRLHIPDQQIVLLAQDPAQLTELDMTLWTFSEADFLPHAIVGHQLAEYSPILLTHNMSGEAANLLKNQILINLSMNTPDNFSHFERLFEIISTNETDKKHGRQRYNFYKQQPYPLSHFVIEQNN